MKRGMAIAIVPLLGLAWAGTRAEEGQPDLATVLARHAEARGGTERWAAVRSLELSGQWEAFSTPGPFTTRRAQGGRWRFEHVLFGQTTIFAHDGEHGWIQGAALGVAEPVRLEDPWVRNLLDDAPLLTPLLAGPGEGLSIELLGRRDVEGADVWALRVARAGLPEETWYLDATSYLEVQRESMTFDVFSGAIETPMVTYFDNFREVDGLVLPFHEERHFGTRYHVTDIESVKVNPEIDAGLFKAPPPSPPPPPEPAEKSDAAAEPPGS